VLDGVDTRCDERGGVRSGGVGGDPRSGGVHGGHEPFDVGERIGGRGRFHRRFGVQGREVADDLHPARAGPDLGERRVDQRVRRDRVVGAGKELARGSEEPSARDQSRGLRRPDELEGDAAGTAGVADAGHAGGVGGGEVRPHRLGVHRHRALLGTPAEAEVAVGVHEPGQNEPSRQRLGLHRWPRSPPAGGVDTGIEIVPIGKPYATNPPSSHRTP
jgi:hypothetical protein